mmetsp:Transcript_33248/g.50987  ORF Transcript_33248/g.50987 Transcript_33248/m.50987 type:complete len:93 (-) Transcript_33248:1241-1519(-)
MTRNFSKEEKNRVDAKLIFESFNKLVLLFGQGKRSQEHLDFLENSQTLAGGILCPLMDRYSIRATVKQDKEEKETQNEADFFAEREGLLQAR